MAAQPVPGEVWAGLRVVRAFGTGERGMVYEARDVDNNRRYALHVAADSGPDGTHAAVLETALRARAAATIPSPFVVRTDSHGVHEDAVYRVTGFFPDGDLRTWVERKGPLTPLQALQLVAAVGRTLDAVHQEGLTHGAVRPEHVLLWRRADAFAAYLISLRGDEAGPETIAADVLAARDLLLPALGGSVDGLPLPVQQLAEREDLHTGGDLATAAEAVIDEVGVAVLRTSADTGRSPSGGDADDEGDFDPHAFVSMARASLEAPAEPARSARPVKPVKVKLPKPPPAPAAVRATAPEPEEGPTEGKGRRRTAIIALVVAVVAVIAGGAAIASQTGLFGGNETDAPTAPTAAASSSPTADVTPTPTPTPTPTATPTPVQVPSPKVASAPAYRAVRFTARTATGATLEQRVDGSWVAVTSPLTVETKRGGVRECVALRAVVATATETGTSKPARECGLSKAPALEVAASRRECRGTTPSAPPCNWYTVRLAGLPSGERIRVQVVDNFGQDCEVCGERPVRIGKDGRGERGNLFRGYAGTTLTVRAAGMTARVRVD